MEWWTRKLHPSKNPIRLNSSTGKNRHVQNVPSPPAALHRVRKPDGAGRLRSPQGARGSLPAKAFARLPRLPRVSQYHDRNAERLEQCRRSGFASGSGYSISFARKDERQQFETAARIPPSRTVDSHFAEITCSIVSGCPGNDSAWFHFACGAYNSRIKTGGQGEAH